MAQATSDSRSLQETMIRRQVIDRGITEPRLLAALRAVPRDRFFPKGSEDDPFADQPASIGHGQTISQPYMVALMTDALAPAPSSRVLEVGTGSGYQTAVLAKLAGEVWSVERVKPLLDQAFERVLELGDGGVAVLPIGQQDRQMLTKVTRDGGELRTKDLCPCRFVKLIGEEGWEEDAEK
jgi:protein-L-isoaspartate(D-aspartate) O-methyltransferase